MAFYNNLWILFPKSKEIVENINSTLEKTTNHTRVIP